MTFQMIIKLAILVVALIAVVWATAYAVKHAFLPTYRTLTNRAYFCKKAAKSDKRYKNKKEALEKLNEIVQEARSFCLKKKCDVKILPLHEVEKREDLGMGICCCMNTIVYTGIWIEKLLTGAPIWKVAFMESIGHEIGHKKDISKGNWFKFCLRPKAERKFFYWTREVLNDYRGIAFVNEFYPGKYSRKTILNAIKKKAKLYDADTRPKKYHKHPTWAFRLELLADNEVFSEDVVRKIAKKAGCKNKAFIDEVAKLSHV